MKIVKLLALLLIVAVAVAGCQTDTPSKPGDKKASDKKAGDKKDDDDHVHGKGPNGGVVFDFGKYHAEFTVDHDKKECNILILGADEKTVKTVAGKDLTIITKETKTKDGKKVEPMTIKLTPKDEKDGKASKYVGSDPGLGNVADFAGTLIGEIDGKQAKGEFKE